MAQSPIPQDIASNPSWHLHDYLPVQQNFVLAFLDELQFAKTPFLDHRLNRHIENFFQVSFEDLDSRFPSELSTSRPAAYIFHIGHCGSTLISRALGATPAVLALREPITLRVLSTCLRDLDNPLSWLSESGFQRLQTIVLNAFERRFRPSQLPIIKATSTSNNLIEPVLGSHPQRKAILIHQALEPYLAGMLRFKDIISDIRTQSQDRLREWHFLSADKALRLSDLEPIDIIVISWLGSMARMALAEEKFPDRVLSLNFEEFLAGPQGKLEELAEFTGLHKEAAHITDSYEDISGFYSKIPERKFSADDRQKVLEKSRHENRELIQAGLERARHLLHQNPSLDALEAFFN